MNHRSNGAFLGALAAAILTVAAAVSSAQMNPRGTATLAEGQVEIDYGRPSAKGRDVLGMIQPDSYWRLGADAATTLETSVPLLFGDSRVEPGKYTLVGHFVTSEEFYLVVARSMSGSRPNDVAARAEGSVERGQSAVETMTIELRGAPADAAFVLSWGESRIHVPFRVAP